MMFANAKPIETERPCPRAPVPNSMYFSFVLSGWPCNLVPISLNVNNSFLFIRSKP